MDQGRIKNGNLKTTPALTSRRGHTYFNDVTADKNVVTNIMNNSTGLQHI